MIKRILVGCASVMLMTLFVLNPKEITESTCKGLIICSEVIIPSLFPFSVLAIFLFSSDFCQYFEKIMNPVSVRMFGINGRAFCAFLISLFGGFPVGARLVSELYDNNSISKNTAQRMLYYSVNAGPAFMIIGIGSTILKSRELGYVLFASNTITSLIICLVMSVFERKEKSLQKEIKINDKPITDIFVESVAKGAESIIHICGFVILFSSVIGIIELNGKIKLITTIVSLLEVSNGVMLTSKSIPFIAFLTVFSGFCVHFQVLSAVKNIKINYIKFVIVKIMAGFLSAIITKILIKVFAVSIPTISFNNSLLSSIKLISFPFSIALIFMAITLIITVKQKSMEKI